MRASSLVDGESLKKPPNLRRIRDIINNPEFFNKAFEEAPSIDAHEAMEEDASRVIINGQPFILTGEDPIFCLDRSASPIKSDSKDCYSCLGKVKRGKYCDFCGNNVCHACIEKDRAFPVNNPNKNRKGNIC